jgi:hypothetical protein
MRILDDSQTWVHYPHMTPRDQNILHTLNVLVLVFRSQKQLFPTLTQEQYHTLTITQEHLTSAGITKPIFINTLSDLNKKGYLMAVSVFEKKYQSELAGILDDEVFEKLYSELEKTDIGALKEQIKIAVANELETTSTSNLHIDRGEVLSEDFDLKELLKDVRNSQKGNKIDVVSTIILSPFRSMERLLEKMNVGLSFDDVKDAGVWYDPIAYELHFDEIKVSTMYQNKPTKAHFALQALFGQYDEPIIYYDDIPEFDLQKDNEIEKRSYCDSLNGFIKKHPRLPELFTVHSDHLVIHETYLEHTH